MKTIWKYRLEGANRELEMPVGAEIVHVGMQREYGQEGLNYEVPQVSLADAVKSMAMEPKETLAKFKPKPADFSDTTQLIILEKQ